MFTVHDLPFVNAVFLICFLAVVSRAGLCMPSPISRGVSTPLPLVVCNSQRCHLYTSSAPPSENTADLKREKRTINMSRRIMQKRAQHSDLESRLESLTCSEYVQLVTIVSQPEEMSIHAARQFMFFHPLKWRSSDRTPASQRMF